MHNLLIHSRPIWKNDCVIRIVYEYLCAESTSVWRCTCLGKVTEVSVTVRSECVPRWYSRDIVRVDGGCGNMECIQELTFLQERAGVLLFRRGVSSERWGLQHNFIVTSVSKWQVQVGFPDSAHRLYTLLVTKAPVQGCMQDNGYDW
jgi:hypothetical protein